MKVTYNPRSNIQIEFEAEGPKQVFEGLSQIQDIFQETQCGKCASKNIAFQVRTVSKFTYHELRCRHCYAVLTFGQSEDGKLYPRRYAVENKQPKLDNQGNKVWLPDGGWTKWDPDEQTRV